MRALLEFAVRGRIPATLIAAGCAGVSLVPHLRFFALFTGGLIVLVTLRYGLYEGLFVLVGTSALFVVAATFFIDGSLEAHLIPLAWAVAVVLLLGWVWGWVMAGALRRVNGQGFALLVGALVGVVALIAFPVFVSNSGDWWREVIVVLGESLRALNPGTDPALFDQLVEVFSTRASIMTGMVVSAAIFIAILMLLMGRWWHAILDNPGGFSREFRQLSLDRRISVAVLLAVVVSFFAGGGVSAFGAEVFSVAFVLFIFQGLAMVHAVVAQTGAWSGWLLVMYVMVVLAPQMLLILATAGFLDTWLDFRKRVRSRTT